MLHSLSLNCQQQVVKQFWALIWVEISAVLSEFYPKRVKIRFLGPYSNFARVVRDSRFFSQKRLIYLGF
jgi:hypothetical protein